MIALDYCLPGAECLVVEHTKRAWPNHWDGPGRILMDCFEGPDQAIREAKRLQVKYPDLVVRPYSSGRWLDDDSEAWK